VNSGSLEPLMTQERNERRLQGGRKKQLRI
jgi:hypothetical protein